MVSTPFDPRFINGGVAVPRGSMWCKRRDIQDLSHLLPGKIRGGGVRRCGWLGVVRSGDGSVRQMGYLHRAPILKDISIRIHCHGQFMGGAAPCGCLGTYQARHGLASKFASRIPRRELRRA